jgi:hypothetical protein
MYNFGLEKVTRNAGIAQLVERDLAKVEVASSSLVSRSRFVLMVYAVAYAWRCQDPLRC